MIDEWLRTNRFTELEFREIMGEPTICVKGRIEVWQLVMVARDYNFDVDKTAEHLDLFPDQVQAALDYYSEYPEDIDLALTENDEGFERLKRLLPNIRVITVDF